MRRPGSAAMPLLAATLLASSAGAQADGWTHLSGVQIVGEQTLSEAQVRERYRGAFEGRVRTCLGPLIRADTTLRGRLHLLVEVAPDGGAVLSGMRGPERARACLEGAIRTRLRLPAATGGTVRSVALVVEFGGASVPSPAGSRTPTECDGELRRRRLPLAECGQGERAPEALADEVSRLLHHAVERSTPRYSGIYEGGTVSPQLRSVDVRTVRRSGREEILAVRYQIYTQRTPGHGVSEPEPVSESRVYCTALRFTGPRHALRLSVPRCLPGFGASVFPLDRRRPSRRMGVGGDVLGYGGEEPFTPRPVDTTHGH